MNSIINSMFFRFVEKTFMKQDADPLNSDLMYWNVMQHVKVINDCNHGQVPWLIIGRGYPVVFNFSLCSSAASSLGYGMTTRP